MSTPSLAQRFTHGNFVDLPVLGAGADFFLGGPARERELVAISKQQLAVAKDAAAAVVASGSETARIIQGEIVRQTNELSRTISPGTEAVVAAVDELADRISSELVLVRWELAQLRTTSDQVLLVLRRPRSTEAQELLEQGIRNLVNDKLEQAEDRLLRALDLDNTDHQILMNLFTVELKKGDASKAAEYAQDALTLPKNLDTRARADALWALARLHYAQGDYRSACRVSRESLTLISTPKRTLQYGIYLVLATSGQQGFSTIETAIRSDPRLLGLAAMSPDLTSNCDKLEKLLDSLAAEAVAHLRAAHEALLRDLQQIRTVPMPRKRTTLDTCSWSVAPARSPGRFWRSFS